MATQGSARHRCAGPPVIGKDSSELSRILAGARPPRSSSAADLLTALRAIAEGQREILRELRQVRQLLEARPGRRRDETAAAALLAAIAEAVPSDRIWNVQELLRHAQAPECRALCDAIVAAAGAARSPARRIGKLVAALEGASVGDRVLQHRGEDRDGKLWALAGLR